MLKVRFFSLYNSCIFQALRFSRVNVRTLLPRADISDFQFGVLVVLECDP